MEAGPRPREHHQTLATLASVLMWLGVLVGAAVLLLRLRYGQRTLGGIPTVVFVWVFFLGSGVLRSLAQGSRRAAWVMAAIGLFACVGYVLIDRFVPD